MSGIGSAEYYGQLVGMKIIKSGFTEGEEGPLGSFPFFILRDKAGDLTRVEVSQDEEGNGPGFLFISDGGRG